MDDPPAGSSPAGRSEGRRRPAPAGPAAVAASRSARPGSGSRGSSRRPKKAAAGDHRGRRRLGSALYRHLTRARRRSRRRAGAYDVGSDRDPGPPGRAGPAPVRRAALRAHSARQRACQQDRQARPAASASAGASPVGPADADALPPEPAERRLRSSPRRRARRRPSPRYPGCPIFSRSSPKRPRPEGGASARAHPADDAEQPTPQAQDPRVAPGGLRSRRPSPKLLPPRRRPAAADRVDRARSDPFRTGPGCSPRRWRLREAAREEIEARLQKEFGIQDAGPILDGILGPS